MNELARGRLLGTVFAALFIAAIVSLLVGFGVPVGIGAAAGFVFGAVVGLVSVFWTSRGLGRAVQIGGTSVSNSGADASDGNELSQLREMSELLGIDLGRPLTVLPVLAAAEAGGYAVELIAVELCEGGLRMTLEVRRSPGSFGPGFMAEVALTDEVGTRYRASGQNSGGTSNPDRYSVVAVPAPPQAARTLKAEVRRFVEPFPGGGRTIDGPWAFTVNLPAHKR